MDDKNLPKVMICIANYNNEQYILDAIKSALVQDYPACGVFITDDKSTDNSVNTIKSFLGESVVEDDNDNYILETFQGHRFPVYLFSLKKNVGRGMVRNFSIDYALRAGYHLVQILDADDMMTEKKVSTLSAIIIQDPQRIGIAYADYFIEDISKNNLIKYESKEVFDWYTFQQRDIIHSGAMINGLALKQHGLYPNISTCEDYHLFRRICKNFIAIHLAEPLTIVRSHSQDSTSSISKQEWDNNIRRVMMET